MCTSSMRTCTIEDVYILNEAVYVMYVLNEDWAWCSSDYSSVTLSLSTMCSAMMDDKLALGLLPSTLSNMLKISGI